MSNRINPIKPRKWSKAGRDYLSDAGPSNIAKGLGVSRQMPSRWSLGKVSTPAARVTEIIEFADHVGVTLTPADLGRPDLAKLKGTKA